MKLINQISENLTVATMNPVSLKLTISRRSHRRCCFIFKKAVLKHFTKFTIKHLCWSHFLMISVIKKRFQHRCFPVNFVKFLRTSTLQNTSV